VTDPELIATFDNFAFAEVLRHGNLDTRVRLMVQLASLLTSQALREYRVMLGAASRWPLPGQSSTAPENRADKGLAVEKQIVGSDIVEDLNASAPEDQLHIQRFLSANYFADHYTRNGIDVPTRELLTFSMLVSLGGFEAQVKGHVAANRNVGSDRGRLIDVLTQLLPFIGYPRTLARLSQFAARNRPTA
jgi:4-carboxymuconolactone decarboxylase